MDILDVTIKSLLKNPEITEKKDIEFLLLNGFKIWERDRYQWKLFKKNLKIEPGYYMTIVASLSGITCIMNKWENGDWLIKSTDDSHVIYYLNQKLNVNFE